MSGLGKKLMPWALLLVAFPVAAQDHESEWVSLATQTCVSQAPNNPYIASMKMGGEQLRYSCDCVARDMLTILPRQERDSLLWHMRQNRNIQAVGEKMFERPAVKKSALAASAACGFESAVSLDHSFTWSEHY